MKVAVHFPGAGTDTRGHLTFADSVEYVVEAEKVGAESVWSAEAWGLDSVVPLAVLAARTRTMRLGTHIMQISARRPSMAAMTALTMALASNGRFVLGLGVSGPQVVEGLHGVPFAHPYQRLREYIEVLRLAFRGERIVYDGKEYQLPRPGGEGKALRLAVPPAPDLPIFLAALGPKFLELTGELADGWLGTSFIPEAADVHLDHIRAGAARVGRRLDRFEIHVPLPAAITSEPERYVADRKRRLAFQLGGMGSSRTNFYNEGYRRVGFAEAAVEVQRLWNDGRREEAVARVPDDLVLQTSLIGTEQTVRDRLRTYRDAGVTMVGIQPYGRDRDEKLETVAKVVTLCTELARERPTPPVGGRH